MDKLKSEFINAIMISLKIEKNPFIVSTIDEYTKDIQPSDFKKFMTELFGTQHAYLNGLDRVSKVAEQFKPHTTKVDETEQKANELIELVHGMNNAVYQKHIQSGVRFDELLDAVKFPKVDETDMAILNNVAPHYDLKTLIAKINHYQTTKDALVAFKQAIEKTEHENKSLKNMLRVFKNKHNDIKLRIER